MRHRIYEDFLDYDALLPTKWSKKPVTGRARFLHRPAIVERDENNLTEITLRCWYFPTLRVSLALGLALGIPMARILYSTTSVNILDILLLLAVAGYASLGVLAYCFVTHACEYELAAPHFAFDYERKANWRRPLAVEARKASAISASYACLVFICSASVQFIAGRPFPAATAFGTLVTTGALLVCLIYNTRRTGVVQTLTSFWRALRHWLRYGRFIPTELIIESLKAGIRIGDTLPNDFKSPFGPRRRRVLITVVCLTCFIAVLVGISGAFYSAAQSFHTASAALTHHHPVRTSAASDGGNANVLPQFARRLLDGKWPSVIRTSVASLVLSLLVPIAQAYCIAAISWQQLSRLVHEEGAKRRALFENDWDAIVTALLVSDDSTEANSIYLGHQRDHDVHYVITKRSMEGHILIMGATNAGKTSRVVAPILTQLIRGAAR